MWTSQDRLQTLGRPDGLRIDGTVLVETDAEQWQLQPTVGSDGAQIVLTSAHTQPRSSVHHALDGMPSIPASVMVNGPEHNRCQHTYL